jgi:hypothetical protein
MVAMGAVSGAFWGCLFDHLKKGRASLSRTSRPTVSVTLVVGQGRRGLSVAVAF